ncbi:MAG: hypothetical protein KDD11_03205, partial [Acidobacteria bacterium]|nr:hypothetical protein [Acidobacteriota bacterium]
MSAPRQRPDRTYLLVGLLGVLLVTLATLQYRWIEQLSEADAERRRVALGVAAERFGEDLDRELTRAYLYFLPAMHHAESDLGARLAARRRLWIESAPYPELLAGIYRVTPVPDGPDLGQLGPQG